MPKYAFPTCTVLALFASLAAFALPAVAATNARVSESYGKLPLQFEANRGQVHKDVRFLSRGQGYALYLTAGEAVLALSKPNADAKHDARSTQAQGKSVALRMSLVGAAHKPQVSGLDELPGKANYFVGKDRSKWRTNVLTYAKVHYQNVYPGIDLVYYGNQRQLEYDFVVAPGADPKTIVLGFRGADKFEIDAEGDLVLHTSGGDVRQHKPVIYQDIDGVRHEIDGSYVRKGANRVGFQLAAYDTTRPLVIDPVVLSYSTYLGGNSGESGAGIAVDADGNAYVTGFAGSPDFPTTAGAFQPTFVSNYYAFVTKFNPAGSALVYSTFLGGSGGSSGSSIAVDSNGNAYVAGTTASVDFPTTAGAFQLVSGGGNDGFVTKLDPTGSSLVFSTYLGGSSSDQANGIAVDTAGNAYVTGQTQSSNFPTSAGALQSASGGCSSYYPYQCDAFVAKLDSTGTALVFSTYLGGSSDDSGMGIAVDADGNAYVTGYTTSPNFPTTAGAFQPDFGGVAGTFVTKLNPTGTVLVYSTYLGGSGSDVGSGIAVDAAGNAYVTGTARSSDFPTTAGAFQVTSGGLSDAFVTKLDPSGSALVYSTYLGGGDYDGGWAIAIDGEGNAYVTGGTHVSGCYCNANFPTTPDAFQPQFAGGLGPAGSGSDAFFTKLNPAGSALLYSTYLGGRNNDSGNGIALDSAGNAYIAGSTNSTNFPTTPGAFQPNSGGGGFQFPPWDAFVAKFFDNTPPPPPPTGTGTTRSEESAATAIGFWTTYGAETGTFSDGSIVASNVAASTAMFSFTGTAVSWIGVKCNVCGIAAVSIDGGAPTTVNTAGPNAPGGLTSESVFSASGLAAASHTISITVTGTSSSGGAYVAVDAFDVTGGRGTPPLVPPVVLPPPPVIVPPLPPIVGL
jgi:hypothetical protein